MPDQDRIIRGLDFEHRVRDALGGRLMPGSGNKWHSRGDVRGKLVVSCKAEATKSWARVREQLREAVDMALGTGAIPALALLDDDEEALVLMRLDDLAKAIADGGVSGAAGRVERGEMTRQLTDTPSMLR